MLHVIGDDRVALGQAKGRDTKIGENAVEHLGDEKQENDEVAKSLLAEEAGGVRLCDDGHPEPSNVLCETGTRGWAQAASARRTRRINGAGRP